MYHVCEREARKRLQKDELLEEVFIFFLSNRKDLRIPKCPWEGATDKQRSKHPKEQD